jgi:hypothetical protein
LKNNIFSTNLGSQLIDERFKGLRKALQSLGKVEQISDGVQSGNFILVTYESHEEAEKALKSLKSKQATEKLMYELETYYAEQKLPKTLVPDLFRYRYDWSDKPIPKKTTKNAFVQPKTETVSAPKATPKQPEEKKEKKKVEKKVEEKEEKKVEKKEEKKVEKKEKATKPVQQEKPVVQEKQPEKKKVDADALRGEAEKARLKDELAYLDSQQGQVKAEIVAEKERSKTRGDRIAKLSEELSRVDLEKQRLERQLNAENHWQRSADERISKLEEELQHMIQEYKGAELQFKNTTLLGKWSDEIEN